MKVYFDNAVTKPDDPEPIHVGSNGVSSSVVGRSCDSGAECGDCAGTTSLNAL